MSKGCGHWLRSRGAEDVGVINESLPARSIFQDFERSRIARIDLNRIGVLVTENEIDSEEPAQPAAACQDIADLQERRP